MTKKIDVSHHTIFFIAAFLLGVWLLSQVLDIILIIFISVILMFALSPAVAFLEKKHLSRPFAAFIVNIGLWILVSSAVAGIIPGLIDQSSRLLRELPSTISRLDFYTAYQQNITQELITRLGSLPENILTLAVGIFSNIINVITVIVITHYLLLERPRFSYFLSLIFPPDTAEKFTRLIDSLEKRLGRWVRGELVLMLSIGILTYIALLILQIDIALPLAILAGLLEIVPNIGPTISAVPAILVALTINPLLAIVTTAAYFIIQFLENNILVPLVMKKAVGVHPLVSIIVLMLGFRLAGPAGALLAIPIIIVVETTTREFFGPVKPGSPLLEV